MPDYDEKTESPTAKKKNEAREQGNIARSMDLSSALMMAGALIMLWLVGERLMHGFRNLMYVLLSGESHGSLGTADNVVGIPSSIGYHALQLTWRFAVGFFAIGLVVYPFLVGFLL